MHIRDFSQFTKMEKIEQPSVVIAGIDRYVVGLAQGLSMIQIIMYVLTPI